MTTRLAQPARNLAAWLTRRGPAAGVEAPQPMVPAPISPQTLPETLAESSAARLLDGRLHAPVLATPPECAEWQGVVDRHAALAAGGDWPALLAALRQADQNRTAVTGGRRLAALISQGARAALGQTLARQDWAAAQIEISRIAAMQARYPQDYAAAHLLAQAQIDLGWARRSAEPESAVSREVWKEFLRRTALAETAMEPFDPLEEDAPILAGTRYLLVRGIEDGDLLCRDWYEDWSDLDPTDPEPHAVHAPHLLPRWFGSLSEFDDEARTAMRRTRQATGAAAYALFYLAAGDSLGVPPAQMDLRLFLTGLEDHAGQTGCQYRANIVAAALAELDHTLSVDDPTAAMARHMVRNALDDHLRNRLREIHLSAWENGEPSVQYALERVFAAELARGEDVHAGPQGLIARLPD
ncbi:MAG: hypothetical protein R3D63_03150 [Paracoccaceae bacterium]